MNDYIQESKVRELLQIGEQVREQKKARNLEKFLIDAERIRRVKQSVMLLDLEI